jgi:DnaK suppressor protein
MDNDRAHELLHAESERVRELLERTQTDAAEQRSGVNELGDRDDAAEPLITEQEDDAVANSLLERLAAIERALQRLADGTYGVSVRSGEPIPDERLEADPAAELTAEEALAP